MLDDVERRRFLVEPARKDSAPLLVRALDIDLHKRARQFLYFPRRGRFAGAQAHDQVLPASRLAGMQRDILHNAVALVENAENRNALRHGRHSALARCRCRNIVSCANRGILLFATTAARNERKCDQYGCGRLSHAYSGIHGS
jgi:hypothetical protein